MDKILIMCGGRGKRLGRVGRMLPKALIKIKGRTILELKMRSYAKQGFGDFILCIGYKGEMIKKAVKSFDMEVNCLFSDGGEPAGILKRLHLARGMFEKNVVLTYGDTYADIDMVKLVDAHISGRNLATIVVAPIQSPFGLVEFDRRGRVTSFKEKPLLNYYIGYAVIDKSALDMIPAKMIDMPNGEGIVAFYKMLMAVGRLGVFYHPGFQITFNTEDELKTAKEKMVSFYTTKEQN